VTCWNDVVALRLAEPRRVDRGQAFIYDLGGDRITANFAP